MENLEETKTSNYSKNESIERYLCKEYEFRFNTVKSKSEFRKKKDTGIFVPVSTYHINSFRRELDRSKIITTTENLRSIIVSNFVPKVDPLKKYFNSLIPVQNGAIEALASTVIVSNQEKWIPYLTKWLVGVAANALDDSQCRNHLCLVLTGGQGKFKTTFLDHLCPQCLKSYLFTGKIDPQSKDTQTLIAEFLFVNIDDQLKELNKKDENALKNLITTPAVKYRRPYDIYIEEYPHTASFMASVNGSDFLSDSSGSRRFIAFEVYEIDIQEAKKINMDIVYSEVMFLFNSGYRYWFNEIEIDELNLSNNRYQLQTLEYEMLVKGFIVPIDSAINIEFLTNSDILNYLQDYTAHTLSSKRLGEALLRTMFVKVSKRLNGNPAYCYGVIKVTPNPFN
jgi:predicted P-loop ATPase